MKAITLHQPWASWIAQQWKTIETRQHNRFASLKGQRIAIHASLRYDEQAIKSAAFYMTTEQIHAHRIHSNGFRWPRGAVVCTAFVRNVAICNQLDAHDALIECNTTRFGLYLEDIRTITPAPFCTGHQGIWNCSLQLT